MKKSFRWMVFSVLAALAAALSVGEAQQRQPFTRPDLVVTGIDFQKVQSGTDAQGNTYWIFNVTAKVKNQGNGNAGAFKVLLERNNGGGGAWQTACPTCLIDIGGLAAGQETTTPPRQFNNAMGMPSKFKFTADSAGQVGESNEGNNSREEAFLSVSVGRAGDIGGATPLLKPDLTPISLDYQVVSESVVNGKTIRTFRLAAKVKNIGPGASAACQIMYERGSDWHACVLFTADKTIPALAPGAEAVVLSNDITHEMGTPGKYFACHADIDKTVAETNENNNTIINKTPYPAGEPVGTAVPAAPRPRLR